MAVLFKAGAQVPMIPLFEVVGSDVNAAPEQIGATAVNAGVKFGFTVMVKVVMVAHCPAVGVKVYVVVEVLFSAGAQVPVIPLLEVVGSGVNVAPEHIGVTPLNTEEMLGLTTIVNVVGTAHCPVAGVKV